MSVDEDDDEYYEEDEDDGTGVRLEELLDDLTLDDADAAPDAEDASHE
jgi:hypothetical protein